MPAPKNPNTAAATAVVRRRGQETMAAKLRAAGWKVTPPEEVHHSADYVAGAETYACPDCGAGTAVGELHVCEVKP